jgi:uncharacterized protein YcnI
MVVEPGTFRYGPTTEVDEPPFVEESHPMSTPSSRRRLRRPVAVLAGAAALVVLVARPASAHVDPDPLAVQAGTTATVAFGVEHGCDGSPTTKVEIKFPDGFTAIKPVDQTGWTSAVAGQVVTFSGGRLDAATGGDFAVSVTAPAAAGLQQIPVVQTCEKGSIEWIEIAKEGAAEPEHPAAPLKITAGAPTAEDLKPAEEEASADAGTKDDSSSNTGVLVGVVIAAVVVAAGAVVVLKKRKPAAKV